MAMFFGIEDTVALDFRDVIVIDFEDSVEEISVTEAEQYNIIDIDLYPFAAVRRTGFGSFENDLVAAAFGEKREHAGASDVDGYVLSFLQHRGDGVEVGVVVDGPVFLHLVMVFLQM